MRMRQVVRVKQRNRSKRRSMRRVNLHRLHQLMPQPRSAAENLKSANVQAGAAVAAAVADAAMGGAKAGVTVETTDEIGLASRRRSGL